jgi:hypothetical protein
VQPTHCYLSDVGSSFGTQLPVNAKCFNGSTCWCRTLEMTVFPYETGNSVHKYYTIATSVISTEGTAIFEKQ